MLPGVLIAKDWHQLGISSLNSISKSMSVQLTVQFMDLNAKNTK
jgi:hypothetical protein